MIIFTESKETAEYIGAYLENYYPDSVLVYNGQGSRSVRREIEANYNPNYVYEKKDNIQYLVTTDVLAEGINLHRSNVIVNYDLPWNPTKVMQRVGRINRVGTEHDKIYVFNFFPSAQANAHLSLEENITFKMQAFHDTLGEDFKYLSEDEEVSSYNLYKKLNSKEIFEYDDADDEESELKYLNIIRKVRDTDENLFEKIKKLPQKSRSGRQLFKLAHDSTLTFLRKGCLKKFFIANNERSKELTFIQAMKFLEVKDNEETTKINKDYFDHLQLNRRSFEDTLTEGEDIIIEKSVYYGNDARIIKILKAISRCKIFTDDQDNLIKKMRTMWEDGNVPASISKEVIKQIKELKDPVQIFYTILELVPDEYFKERRIKKKTNISGNIKIILSLYLKKGEAEDESC